MLVEGVMKRELRELRIASLVATLLAAVALVGCAARIHVPFVPGDKLAGPTFVRSAPSEFEYIDSLPKPVYVITAEDAAYRTVSLAFPSAGENGQAGDLVTARYHRSKSKGAKPLVIVLPIWGIHTYPSNTISAGLRKRGGNINVLQIDGERPLLDWDAVGDTRTEAEFFDLLDQMIGRFVSTVFDIRRVVDWAETQTDVDPQRIALIGFSMGALVASVAMANEPRLAAGVLVMGGADLHDVLAACGHEIARGRKHILSQLLGPAEMRRLLFTHRPSELQLNRRQHARELMRLSRLAEEHSVDEFHEDQHRPPRSRRDRPAARTTVQIQSVTFLTVTPFGQRGRDSSK